MCVEWNCHYVLFPFHLSYSCLLLFCLLVLPCYVVNKDEYYALCAVHALEQLKGLPPPTKKCTDFIFGARALSLLPQWLSFWCDFVVEAAAAALCVVNRIWQVIQSATPEVRQSATCCRTMSSSTTSISPVWTAPPHASLYLSAAIYEQNNCMGAIVLIIDP